MNQATETDEQKNCQTEEPSRICRWCSEICAVLEKPSTAIPIFFLGPPFIGLAVGQIYLSILCLRHLGVKVEEKDLGLLLSLLVLLSFMWIDLVVVVRIKRCFVWSANNLHRKNEQNEKGTNAESAGKNTQGHQTHKASLFARWIVAMTSVLEKPSVAFAIFLIGIILSIGAVFEALFFHKYCLCFPFQNFDGDGKYLFMAEVLVFVWLDIYVAYVIKKMMGGLKNDLSREFVKQEEDVNKNSQGTGDGDPAPTEVKNTKNILELDLLIRRYAWEMLLKRQDLLSRQFLEAEDEFYTCEVDWTALTFEHKVVKFSPNVKDGTVIESQRGEMQTGSKWVTLWSCDFDNKADSKQSHAFRGSRDTTTWVDVDLEQSYTVNKKLCVQLNIPQNSRIGKENTLLLNKVKGQVHKEVLTWEVKTQVEVEPWSRAHAQLLARQECSAFDLEIRTTLSNPKGVVPVRFVRQRDKQVVCALNIKNLADVFQLAEEGGVLKPEEKVCVEVVVEKWLDKDGVEHSTSHPQLITRGSCVCLSWTDQKVDITTSQISLDEYMSDGYVSDNKSPGNLMNQDVSAGSYFS